MAEKSSYSMCYACGSKDVVRCEFCNFFACKNHAIKLAENTWVCLRCSASQKF